MEVTVEKKKKKKREVSGDLQHCFIQYLPRQHEEERELGTEWAVVELC